MKYCKKCRVDIRGNHFYCPLCQSPISDKKNTPENQEVFPYLPTTYHKYNMFFRIILFISVIIGVLSIALDFLLFDNLRWSIFVIPGILCVWGSLAILIKKKNNIPKTILWQVILICILAILWDWFTGWHNWSLDYVIPVVCISAMITMAIISNVMHLRIGDYMIYLVIDSLFGVLPIIIYWMGLLTVTYPSILCISGSIISLAALLLFEGYNMKGEIKRRVHL